MRMDLVCVALVLAAASAAMAAEHPRLMFGREDVPALRRKITQEPWKPMFESLVKSAETDSWGAGPIVTSGDRAYAAQRCAFLYVLTGDDNWARKSRGYVETLINSQEWANGRIKGLMLYTLGGRVAMAYDWCHGAPSWDKAFAETVSKKLLAMADVIFRSGGTEQNQSPASNWQALRWSSAGLIYLAIDEPNATANVPQCYGRVDRYLKENLGTGKGSRGWNIEGLGYNYYPMGNGVCPFAVAMHRIDPSKDLRKSTPGAAYTLWTVYAAMVRTNWGIWRPDFGDDNPGTNAEGTMGFAFWFCPPELHPGLKWWYDRTFGAKGERTFDRSRFGAIASILYYPGNEVVEKDPMTLPQWLAGFDDTDGGNGYVTFRNRYQDNNDVVAQMYLKLRGNKGHSGADALTFRIAGMDGLFATGGGRYGPKLGAIDAFHRSMNTLYPVDPDGPVRVSGDSGKAIGKPLIKPDGGGHVVASINHNNVGTTNHKRWFIADYSAATGADAAFVIVDSSDDGKFWQMVTLENNRLAADQRSFTITSPGGQTLRATVLHPAGNLQMKTGKRIRGSNAGPFKENLFVHFQGDGHYVVAITMAKRGAAHPQVSADGTWGKDPNGTVKIGNRQVRIVGDQITYP